MTILGPTQDYHAELVAEQQEVGKAAAQSSGQSLLEAARSLGQRFLAALPVEIPFADGDGTSPRNNSSVITLLKFGGFRGLLCADAGVPALERAWDYLAWSGLGTQAPEVVQVAHRASRRNASSDLTRKRDEFRLVFEENVNYGFRRNLLGLRPWALPSPVQSSSYALPPLRSATGVSRRGSAPGPGQRGLRRCSRLPGGG